MITSLDQLDPNGSYTYADYYLWQFPERVELLRGKVRQIVHPLRVHQSILGKFVYFFGNALWKHPAHEVYAAPFDVRLFQVQEDKDAFTVVQPDLCVICDRAKLDDRGCNGAPDLIVEVLMNGNSRTEMKDKFEL
jgi:Uma2 family endonuclease